MKYISSCSLSFIISQIQNDLLEPKNLIDELCDKIDNWDSKIKAFLPEKNRRERLQKELLDLNKKFPIKKNRPIFFGIPVGIKDIFIVDGFETKAGANLPSKLFEGDEADVVRVLKKNGALILGKMVTTEFAYFHPGSTANPHNIKHTPGGSSSGSAAAVAAGFCPLSFGTQTIGSISRPASFCGVIGFKPSYDRISINGVIPFSASADHVGFFTQDMKGVDITASIIVKNWNNSCKMFQKPVFGIPQGKYLEQASEEVLEAFYKSIEVLKNRGYEVKSIPIFEDIEDINAKHRLMNAAEFSQVHNKWQKEHKDKYHKASLELIEKGNNVDAKDLNEAIADRELIRDKIDRIQNQENIDIWISPSAPTVAPKGLSSTGNPIMNLPWTYIGVPTLSIPFGFIDDLPYGIQFAGKFNKDEELVFFLKDF